MTNINFWRVFWLFISILPCLEAWLFLNKVNRKLTIRASRFIILIAIIMSGITLAIGWWLFGVFSGEVGIQQFRLLVCLGSPIPIHFGILITLLFFNKIVKRYGFYFKVSGDTDH
jgi:hypothetical protein